MMDWQIDFKDVTTVRPPEQTEHAQFRLIGDGRWSCRSMRSTKTINRVIYVLGQERVMALLVEAQRVEADGGLLTDDGQQRRTPGGTYFKLVKDKVNGQERGRIFTPAKAKPKPKLKLEPPAWEVLLPLVEEFLAQPRSGACDKVKLTLIGRPGKVIKKEAVVLR